MRNEPTQPGLPEWDDNSDATLEHRPAGTPPSQTKPGLPPGGMPLPLRRKSRRRRSQKRRRTRLQGCLRLFLLTALILGVLVAAAGLIAGVVIYNSLAAELEEDLEVLESLAGVEDFQSSRIYDRDGVLLYELFEEGRRTEVPLTEVPFAMRQAIIATEDNSFYTNPGFDPPSIVRAALDWFRQGEIVSGASTITQQLVRQIVFDYDERVEVTLRRKLKEAALAWVMTQRFSKDEILELYLNEIYYGNLAYGIEGAANVYFDKPARELTLSESAFLAGLVQLPAAYDPYTNFTAAKLRQRTVLNLMVRHGYLTPEEADLAFNQPPLTVNDLASPNVSLLAPHFTVEVRRLLAETPGIDAEVIRRGGLYIYTTLDMDIQNLAQQVVAQRVAEVREEYNLTNAALVAIHPYTGEVLAMVGSVNYADETIDGAVNNALALNQPGSTMKPLTYAAALEQGWTAADILWDVPMAYDTGIGQGFDYVPHNYDNRFHGPVRLRNALANSYNIPAVTLLREVGVPDLLEMAGRAGITSLGQDPALYGLSLTLGGGEVTPLEMTSAFAMFANGGRRVQPYLIARIEDRTGHVLYQAPEVLGEQVLDERIAFLIADILSDNRARTPAMGADSALRLDFPAAAKTGTTNDFRDNWTIGFTPHLAVGVWAGNADNSPMAEGTSGLTGAAPIWHDFMTAVYARDDLAGLLMKPGLPELRSPFQPPAGVIQQPVCVLSSLTDPQPAAEGCPETRQEWFLDSPPIRYEAGQPLPPPAPTPTLEPSPLPTAEDGQPLPLIREQIEPGLFVIGVLPLTEELQTQAGELLRAAYDSLPQGVPRPPAPRYCEIPQEQAGEVQDITFQIFIAAPPDSPDRADDDYDAIRARDWAYSHGVPIDPGFLCTTELVDALARPADLIVSSEEGAAYRIDRPRANQEVHGVVPITGTALFDPLRVAYYKVEIQVVDGSPNPWITLGETHPEPVEEGVLEYLHADALTPGSYLLRLVLVRIDASELQPFIIPITIVPPPTP
ncbi:MAG: hypothetical protein Kow00124_17070 [Anaerolineae bacterium]